MVVKTETKIICGTKNAKVEIEAIENGTWMVRTCIDGHMRSVLLIDEEMSEVYYWLDNLGINLGAFTRRSRT